MSKNNNRERADRLNDLAAELQEMAMRKLLEKIEAGTATAADLKLAMDTADKSGLVLNPESFPQTLKDRLTTSVDPKKFAPEDPDVAGTVN